MSDIRQRGFGLLGLIIVIVIIVSLVFGWKKFSGQSQKNQIQQGNEAIDRAQDAADQVNENNIYLQNEINSSADVNYGGVRDKLDGLK
jgi:type II secretory pathway pseudopilin PulG